VDGAQLQQLKRTDIRTILAKELHTNIASLSIAQLDACIGVVERLQIRPADSMLQLLLGAIETSTNPTLICASDGTIFAVNDAAVFRQVVVSPLAVHVTDVIIGGDAVWTALIECIDDPRRAVVVLPTCTGLVCAWRISRRDDLYLIAAEHVGAEGADAFAKQANGESSSATQVRSSRVAGERRQRHNRSAAAKRNNVPGFINSNNNSDSSTTTTNDSRDDVADSSDSSADALQSDESNLRTLAQGKQSRPRIPSQASPRSAHDASGSALAPVASAPPASPLPSSSDSSRSSSAPLQSTRASSTTSGSATRKPAPVARSSSSSGKSRLLTRSATIDFGNDPMVARNVIYSGPMSTVVRATVGGFDVAAKILPTRYMASEEKAELRATLMLAATLQHRSIVRQLGFNLSASHEWIVYTELCDKALDDHIRNAPVTIDTVHQALQVAQAIQFIHLKSVMHRDIKSQNVLVRVVGGEAVLKLSDLGDLAVIVSGQSYRTGVGTPEFMAPEVVAVATVRFRAYGAPCDIWSFGMLVFELITGGSVPYSDVSRWKLGETIAAGVRPTLPAKSDRGGLIEAQLIELFVECTRLRPDERLTASAACSRLEKILKNVDV
jgi:hypothetical protein